MVRSDLSPTALLIIGGLLLIGATWGFIKRDRIEHALFHMLDERPDWWNAWATFASYTIIIIAGMAGGLMLFSGLGWMGDIEPLP